MNPIRIAIAKGRLEEKTAALFERAGIPIIRLGLNPTEELSAGAAAGGAYHPALGELVRSRIMLERMRELLSDVPAGSTVTLEVGKGRTSQAVGQHRGNITKLCESFRLKALKIREGDSKNNDIKIVSVEMRREM